MSKKTLQEIRKLTKVTEFRLKLYPRDFHKVKNFYEKTLGFQIANSWDEKNNKGVMFNTGDAILELLTPKKGYQALQGAGVSLMVKDVWTLWKKLNNHPDIVQTLKTSSWGDTGFQINDPEGFQLTFFTPASEKKK